MQAVAYYLFYAANWIITLLPLPVLYIFSDLIYPFFYYFPGYRRRVVRTNLLNSFPEKSIKEIISIEKKFYRHLCDLFIETFKLTHMTNANLMKRYRVTNPELLERLRNDGRDIVAVLGHYGNWEWLVCLPLYTSYQTVSIYKPLQNRHFDRHMLNARSRNGMKVTPMSHIIRDVISLRNENTRSLFAFITDQTPPKGDIKYWTSFLNQDTPVYLGAEKVAVKYDMSVVFFKIRKIKRGFYTLTVDLLFESSTGLKEHQVTETHVRKLEEIIKENPEYWIWSHRRWKHKRETANA
jgi:KDO2-lipid IV(A) lauroyltransferase